jgi:heme-degrading monooxygenase HmoA
MFIAMNRLKVRTGDESAFEARWLDRDSHLHAVPGFIEFHLLRGPEREDHVLYASHTLWRSHAEFEAWTRSEAFRAAPRDAGQGRSLTISHPEFEGFEVLQTVSPIADDRWQLPRSLDTAPSREGRHDGSIDGLQSDDCDWPRMRGRPARHYARRELGRKLSRLPPAP